jgi:outer membrane protein TolC
MRSGGALGALLLAAACGCETYEAKPLDEAAILESVRAARRPAGGSGGLTLGRLAALARDRSPALVEARAAHASALALAGVPTPWPNPTVEVGAQYGFGADVEGRRLQPVGALGFAIPISGRLADQDALNRLNAGAAGVEVAVRHREVYLDLREQFAGVSVLRARRRVCGELEELARRTSESVKALVAAGDATALDANLLELEALRVRLVSLEAEALLVEAESDLAESSGLHPSELREFADPALPELPAEPPPLDDLAALLVAEHPSLARLRAAYDVAEGELRLEVAKQYPDIQFGAGAEGDPGERKYVVGLTLGISVPLFDRNQQGIALACARREEVRARYEAAASRALASLERAWARASLALRRWALVKGLLADMVARQRELTKGALEAGESDVLKVLESERSILSAALEALEAERASREGWSALERAVGRPLLEYPGEVETERPRLPERGAGEREEDGR